MLLDGESRTTIADIAVRFNVIYANRMVSDQRPRVECGPNRTLTITYGGDPEPLTLDKPSAMAYLKYLEVGNHGSYRTFRTPAAVSIGAPVNVQAMMRANTRMRQHLERIRAIGYKANETSWDKQRDLMTTLAGEAMLDESAD